MNTIKDGGPAFPTYASDHRGAACNTTFEPKGGMTLRQYAAISLRVPQSGEEWLDEMISEARRLDAAAKALQGLLAAQIHGFNDSPANGPFARMAYEMADAMLKAREVRNDHRHKAYD